LGYMPFDHSISLFAFPASLRYTPDNRQLCLCPRPIRPAPFHRPQNNPRLRAHLPSQRPLNRATFRTMGKPRAGGILASTSNSSICLTTPPPLRQSGGPCSPPSATLTFEPTPSASSWNTPSP